MLNKLIMTTILLMIGILVVVGATPKVPNDYVVMFFTAKWCPSCRIMKNRVIPTTEVQAALAGRPYDFYIVDTDLPENSTYMSTYYVSSIPQITIVKRTEDPAKAVILDSKVGVVDSQVLAKWLNDTK